MRHLIGIICLACGLVFSGSILHAQSHAVATHGQLRVIGNKLCNQFGEPVQLRGMSTHGLQWYSNCINSASLDVLATNWNADILRISMYVQEGGYATDPPRFTALVRSIIDQVTARGMYALIDFHQLSPGDPMANLSHATNFFTAIATSHGHQNNIIYDICNEPNGVTWARIKEYATNVIPVIRAIDPDAPILIGTHGWASLGISDGRTANDIFINQVPFTNIMYTFHFYAKSHRTSYLNELKWASDRMPIFVTEFGSQEYTGDGSNDFPMTQQFIDLMRTNQISWCNWNYSSDFRSGAVWVTGNCPNGPWTTNRLKEAGLWIRERILEFRGPPASPPQVSITSPTNLTVLPKNAAFTISATAADTNSSITAVAFFVNGNKVGQDNLAPYESPLLNLPEGSYTLTAAATNALGLSGVSAPVQVQIGNLKVIYRETFGRPPPPASTANSNVVFWGWREFVNAGTVYTGTAGVNGTEAGRRTDVTNVNAGTNNDGTTNAYVFGWHYHDQHPRCLSFTPEFSFNPADYVPGTVAFSWYQGNASTSHSVQVIVRVGGKWYASAQTFSNSAASSPANFGTVADGAGGAELKTLTFNPAAANWRVLNYNGDYDLANTVNSTLGNLSVGAVPDGDLSGPITAFGLYSDNNGASSNRRFDTFTIVGELLHPPFSLTDIGLWDGHIRFSFPSQPARTYRVEYKESLTAPLWTELSRMDGTGDFLHASNILSASREGFFRVVAE